MLYGFKQNTKKKKMKLYNSLFILNKLQIRFVTKVCG